MDAAVFVADAVGKGKDKGKEKRKNKSNSKGGKGDKGGAKSETKQSADDSSSKGQGPVCNLCHKHGHKMYACSMLEECKEYTMKKRSGAGEMKNKVDAVHFHVNASDDEGERMPDYVVLPTVSGELDEFDVLLDNQATVSVIRNPILVTNVREADQPVRVRGIGGDLIIDREADFGDFGTVYFDERALTNVLCYADVEDQGVIVYR